MLWLVPSEWLVTFHLSSLFANDTMAISGRYDDVVSSSLTIAVHDPSFHFPFPFTQEFPVLPLDIWWDGWSSSIGRCAVLQSESFYALCQFLPHMGHFSRRASHMSGYVSHSQSAGYNFPPSVAITRPRKQIRYHTQMPRKAKQQSGIISPTKPTRSKSSKPLTPSAP